ncbi:hypothetical protein BDN72DRAFT_850026 [Pluteus cervinus]|uniref:Uncharacterized protein n=1 Tax=Pluteus cervinus TaxID=181527 RepID=A0ACD3A5P0_9AGAR|nr:hypothetical protein BDN72DRAFT_850026 [Pluteus cervinus]
MSSTSHEIFPPELEELIFSLAFHNNRKDVMNLILVAKRVHEWLIPEVYKVTMFYSGEGDVGRLKPSSKNLVHYGQHVRHLMLSTRWGPEKTGLDNLPSECLSFCPNVVDIALWLVDPSSSRQLIDQLLNLPNLTRLSLNLRSFDAPLANDPSSRELPHPFSTVTHLDILGITAVYTTRQIQQLFPSLTHIAFNRYGVQNSAIEDVLNAWNSQLKVVVWHHGTSTQPWPEVLPTSEYTQVDDPRLVIMRYSRGYIEGWYHEAIGRRGLWTMAEEAVKSRRQATTPDRVLVG